LFGATHVRGAPFVDPPLAFRRQEDQEVDRPFAFLLISIAESREEDIRSICPQREGEESGKNEEEAR
jgi:hypothetical protein